MVSMSPESFPKVNFGAFGHGLFSLAGHKSTVAAMQHKHLDPSNLSPPIILTHDQLCCNSTPRAVIGSLQGRRPPPTPQHISSSKEATALTCSSRNSTAPTLAFHGLFAVLTASSTLPNAVI